MASTASTPESPGPLDLAELADTTVVIMSPALLTSVTIERGTGGVDEIHIHPAGQGYWVARMVKALGARPVLVTTCGGEPASAAVTLVDDGIGIRTIPTRGAGGVYVDDRRSGERQRLADAPAIPIGRHAIDDLVAATVAEGLNAGIVVLTGSNGHSSVPPEMFSAVSSGLHALGVTVVADLSGDELGEVLDGHVDVIKVAADELGGLPGLEGVTSPSSDAGQLDALRKDAARLRERCGADVFITRASAGVVACTEAGDLTGSGPVLETVDPRGAGDSFTAALAVGRGAGLATVDQLRLALAAAATNVLRHGLGSATKEAVDSMLDQAVVTVS